MKSTTKIHENLSLDNLPNEIWKDILGFEGYYQISNLGRVKSLERKIKTKYSFFQVEKRIRKISFNTDGYCQVSLRKDRKSTTVAIHRLVAKAFLNHNSKGNKIVIDHVNYPPTAEPMGWASGVNTLTNVNSSS